MLKWIIFTLVAVCGCYYFWPRQTVHTVSKITATTEAGVKGAYREARK